LNAWRRAGVALGGNVEPERRLPEAAAARTLPRCALLALLPLAAVGFDGEDFLRAAVFDTGLGPAALVAALHAIEEQLRSRSRRSKWTRRMDIDLLMFGGLPAMRG
jgi:2-amino-4-hydroxy-6-hydroxymethyldihydropteridine diphosphokinase